MLNKKLLYILSAAVMAAALTGCGNDSENVVKITTENTAESDSVLSDNSDNTDNSASESEPSELKAIGEKTDSATLCTVRLANSTGKDIKELSVKPDKENTEYPDNMLKDDTFKLGEERILYYDPGEVTENTDFLCDVIFDDTEETSTEDNTSDTNDTNNTESTDTTDNTNTQKDYTIHKFPVTAEKVEICFSADDNVAYLKYRDADGNNVNTLDDERKLAGVGENGTESTDKTDTSQNPTGESGTVAVNNNQAQNNNNNNNQVEQETVVYYETQAAAPAETQPAAPAETQAAAPAETQPAEVETQAVAPVETQPAAAPETQAAAPAETQGDANDGCLGGDGLFN